MALSTRYSSIHEPCCYCGKMLAANKMVQHKLKFHPEEMQKIRDKFIGK